MATSPTTSTFHHSEIPPWKIELIQKKKKVVNVTGGCHSYGNASTDDHNIMSSFAGDSNAGKCPPICYIYTHMSSCKGSCGAFELLTKKKSI